MTLYNISTYMKHILRACPLLILTFLLPRGEAKPIKVALLSSYPPTPCGIAEFTRNLSNSLIQAATPETLRLEVFAIEKQSPPLNSEAEAEAEAGKHRINDIPVHRYRLTPDTERETVKRIGNALSKKKFSAVLIQHEYGLMNNYSNYVTLLNSLSEGVTSFVFLHTGTPFPGHKRREAIQEIAIKADYLVSLSWKTFHALVHTYGVPQRKILYLPHGVPEVPSKQYLPSAKSDRLDSNSKKSNKQVTLLISGLIRRTKGIPQILSAMGKLKPLKGLPKINLLILGKETDPGMYLEVQQQATREGIGRRVKWIREYQTSKQMLKRHQLADIYLAPFTVDVPSSGTLSYAMACGLPVIATPFGLSGELLKQPASTPEFTAGGFSRDKDPNYVCFTEYGAIVPFGSVSSLAEAIRRLALDPLLRQRLGGKAHARMRLLSWARVGQKLLEALLLNASAGASNSSISGVHNGNSPPLEETNTDPLGVDSGITRVTETAFIEDPYRGNKKMLKGRAEWSKTTRKALDGLLITSSIPNGPYCFYSDAHLCINVLIRNNKILHLAAKVITYTGGRRHLVPQQGFLYMCATQEAPLPLNTATGKRSPWVKLADKKTVKKISYKGKLASRGNTKAKHKKPGPPPLKSPSKPSILVYGSYKAAAPDGSDLFQKAGKNRVLLTTPNLIVQLEAARDEVIVSVLSVCRFSCAGGIIGASLIKRLSGMHRAAIPGLTTWKIFSLGKLLSWSTPSALYGTWELAPTYGLPGMLSKLEHPPILAHSQEETPQDSNSSTATEEPLNEAVSVLMG